MVKVFQFSSIKGDHSQGLQMKIKLLGGRFIDDHHFVPDCTHLIVPATSSLVPMKEKVGSGLAACKWVLTPEYVNQSFEANKWLDERDFRQFTPVSDNDSSSRKLFSKCNVLLHMSPSSLKSQCRRILEAGGANITADQPIRDEADCVALKPVTHVIYCDMDPFSPPLRKILSSINVEVLSVSQMTSIIRYYYSGSSDNCGMGTTHASDVSTNSPVASQAMSVTVSDFSSSLPLAITFDQVDCDRSISFRPSAESPTTRSPDSPVSGNSNGDQAADSGVSDSDAHLSPTPGTAATSDSPGSDQVVCKQETSDGTADSEFEDNELDAGDEEGWTTCSDEESDSESPSVTKSRAPVPLIQTDVIRNDSIEQDNSDLVRENEDVSVTCNEAHVTLLDAGPEQQTATTLHEMSECDKSAADSSLRTGDAADQSVQMDVLSVSPEKSPARPEPEEPDDGENGKRKAETADCEDCHVKKIKSEPDEHAVGGDHPESPQVTPEIPNEMLPIVEAFCCIRIPENLLKNL